MPDSIVSVRMPESLMEELRQVANEQHYMDLSEAIRNLIRKKLEEKNNPQAQQLILGLQKILREMESEA